ncbi:MULTISPECIES: hypothetical protein [unclassified Aureimonas]|uniref:hypothetical protein n=1 Tax=unclassified Aureimonas TaxID=2615206 RepID=UPI0006F9A1DB|nr:MULTISPECIES: hypothetical protein [unclassified Aureimonas]KQT57476.1 hypothetical protein ASG62_09155 [Aureimonas sp. Leaf427]KQT77156.1 hypothetical protein ASG54_13025 [Aureimonas sp. Leaf460]
MLHITPEFATYLRQELGKDRARKARRAAVSAKVKYRKLNTKRFIHLVGQAKVILAAGDPTVFAFEGASRHGLRIGLIERGWAWKDADSCAAEIVAAALKELGATRPSWADGQPDFVSSVGTLRTFCAHCNGRIPPDRKTHAGNPVKYCSFECGQYAYRKKASEFGEQVSLAEYLTRCAERSAKTLEERARNCEQCNKRFLSSRLDARFCSTSCVSESQRRSWEVSCVGCGKTFTARPGTKNPKYCSLDCYTATARSDREVSCGVCRAIFRPRFSEKRGLSKFCSTACSASARAGLREARPVLSCKTCGQTFQPDFPSQKRSFCSVACNPYASKADKAKAASAFNCEACS